MGQRVSQTPRSLTGTRGQSEASNNTALDGNIRIIYILILRLNGSYIPAQRGMPVLAFLCIMFRAELLSGRTKIDIKLSDFCTINPRFVYFIPDVKYSPVIETPGLYVQQQPQPSLRNSGRLSPPGRLEQGSACQNASPGAVYTALGNRLR